MINKILTITLLSTLFLMSCKEKAKQENKKENAIENVSETIVNKNGEKLKMTFNNTKGTVKLNFNGENIELFQEKAASGIWYKNATYELRGKGNNIELKKNEKVIFKHQDDIVNIQEKNSKGDVLNLTFNNTEGTVKIYLNGGKQIDLVAEKAASGIWYKNNEYELRGKGENIELTKNGKTVFKK